MSRTSTPTSRSTKALSRPAAPDPSAADGSPRILGVDPGSIATGWGLIGGSAARPTWIEAGVLRLGAGGPLASRLGRLHEQLTDLVHRLRPTSAAVESPFQGANARAAFQLAQARGVVLAVLARAGLDVHEYAPATVKKAVTGHGRAGKPQVQAMVGQLLDRPLVDGGHDLSDALAVALCHSAIHAHRSLVERPRGDCDNGRARRRRP